MEAAALPDVNIILGPPGTGKTHRLMHYLDEELKKTDPEKIAYIDKTMF